MAWRKTGEGFTEEGYPTETWEDGKGNWVIWVWVARNEAVLFEGSDNPNPEDSSSGGKGDWASRLALAKQKGRGVMTIDPSKTPFGKLLTGRAEGLQPVHNPADIYKEYEDIGGGGGPGGGFGGDGESFLQWLKRRIKQGGGSDDDKGGDNPPPPATGEELPGPPELVNPAARQYLQKSAG